MAAETTVAESIRIIDEKIAYDAACKRVLAEKIILAWVMKHCLVEFHDCEVTEIAEKFIEGTPQVGEIPVMPDETNQTPRIGQTGVEDKTLTEGTIYYDIRFDALAPVSGELIGLIINLEAQNKYDPGYPEQNYDLMSVIMVCLGRPESENYEGVLKLLGVLLSQKMEYSEKQRILECEFEIPMKEKLESEVSSMCNLSDGVEARGIEQGIEKGITSNTLRSVRSLMETVGWTAEQAMDALKIPKEEREKYMKMLEN